MLYVVVQYFTTSYKLMEIWNLELEPKLPPTDLVQYCTYYLSNLIVSLKHGNGGGPWNLRISIAYAVDPESLCVYFTKVIWSGTGKPPLGTPPTEKRET